MSGPAVVEARFARNCAARSATGFAVTTARKPRRVLVHIRLQGKTSAGLRLWRGQKQIAEKTFPSVGEGARVLRLDVPKATPKGMYRVVLRLRDSCGVVRRLQKSVSIPSR